MLFSVITISAIFFSSCKKKEDNEDNSTRTELLTSGSWRLISFELVDTTGQTPPEDGFELFDSCLTDNLTYYYVDGTRVIDEGQLKCNTNDPQTVLTDTWTFTNNETRISFQGNQSAEIILLDKSSLTLKSNYLGSIVSIRGYKH